MSLESALSCAVPLVQAGCFSSGSPPDSVTDVPQGTKRPTRCLVRTETIETFLAEEGDGAEEGGSDGERAEWDPSPPAPGVPLLGPYRQETEGPVPGETGRGPRAGPEPRGAEGYQGESEEPQAEGDLSPEETGVKEAIGAMSPYSRTEPPRVTDVEPPSPDPSLPAATETEGEEMAVAGDGGGVATLGRVPAVGRVGASVPAWGAAADGALPRGGAGSDAIGQRPPLAHAAPPRLHQSQRAVEAQSHAENRQSPRRHSALDQSDHRNIGVFEAESQSEENRLTWGSVDSCNRGSEMWNGRRFTSEANQEFFKKPKFFIDSFSTTDIVQGRLGDCWFLAAMSSLTLDANLFRYVVPSDQSFQENYAGIFHFRFWQYGRWVEVCVDDYLPTRNQSLIFTASSTWTELWSALLEKAYAKLHGSYSILSGGLVSEAMEDFTGGISVSIEMADTKPKELWRIVKQALNKQTMISCSIQQTDGSGEVETERPMGLLAGHAYSIVDADRVRLPKSSVRLFRLRNPWGRKEYSGPWSDRSPTWNEVSQEEKVRLKLKFSEEGEFWIPANILVEQFSDVELCSIGPMCEHSSDCVWGITNHEGMWMAGVSAGGNLGHDTFSRNPQYRLQLLEEDKDSNGGEPACTIAVQLLQKDGRRIGSEHLYISFHIFAVPKWHEGRAAPFGRKFFQKTRAVFESGTYTNSRSVSRRMQLPAGQYVIVPSTYSQDEERGFFLRIFAQKNNLSRENGSTLNDFNLTAVRTETDAASNHRRNSEMLHEATAVATILSAPEFMEVFNSAAAKRFH
ncbi:LOW QUALITY PROTEIN: calpain-9-like, partial [Rhinoraja longicauda]